jgi:hypothetical protein
VEFLSTLRLAPQVGQLSLMKLNMMVRSLDEKIIRAGDFYPIQILWTNI